MSGCRCSKRNEEVGGEPNSDHLRGTAADIDCAGSSFRFVAVRRAYALNFKRIGLYAKEPIIHLSVDTENPQIVMWVR